MRTARTLVAGAALTACLALAAPAAHAAGAVNIYDPSGQGSSSSSSSSSSSASDSGKYSHSSDSDGSQDWTGQGSDGGQWHKPHGGMHTGGGGMSLAGGSSLAAGSVLLLGGLGAGAYVLRRRRGTAGAAPSPDPSHRPALAGRTAVATAAVRRWPLPGASSREALLRRPGACRPATRPAARPLPFARLAVSGGPGPSYLAGRQKGSTV